jgi:translation initiation factor IF-3
LKKKDKRIRINEEIRAKEVKVISKEGKMLGIFSLTNALKIAEEEGVELVEVVADITPPICKIMDYGKYKYEQRKKEKRRKKTVEIKELKITMKIQEHDLDIKVKKGREILEQGDKLRVKMKFRGREIMYQEEGMKVMMHFFEKLSDVGRMEVSPHMEGRSCIMVIGGKRSEG